jgi:hypothetical protein
LGAVRPRSEFLGADHCRKKIDEQEQRDCRSDVDHWGSPLDFFTAFEEQEAEAHGKYAQGEHADKPEYKIHE